MRWCAAFVLVACGNTASQVDPGTAGMGGAVAGGADTAGSATQSGGSQMAAAGAGGTSSSEAGGGVAGVASVPLEEQPLLPLVPGHHSSFVFTPIDDALPMLETCAEPTTSIESGAGLSFDGHEGTLYRTFCAPEPFLIEGQGDSLTAYEINDGELVPPAFNYIHSPVVTGEMWDSGRGDRYTWQELPEAFETAAGTFTACFHRHGTDTRMTYCRGVGLVQALAEYANYQLDLVSKSF